MKTKGLIAVCIWLCGGLSMVKAQQVSDGEFASRREEMVNRQAERLVKDWGLKEDAETSFLDLYRKYRQELAAARKAVRRSGKLDTKNTMTDEEATQRIQDEFDFQAQQIVDLYNRLEIEKKYYAEFSKILSPKQMVRIFSPSREPRDRGGEMRNRERMRDMPEGF